jgi:hypothetical protein
MVGVRAWELGSQQQGREGGSAGTAAELGRTRTQSSTVNSTFLISAHNVFDTMPARVCISNFFKIPLWDIRLLNMGSRNIFVGLRGDDLLQKKKTNGKVSVLNSKFG